MKKASVGLVTGFLFAGSVSSSTKPGVERTFFVVWPPPP